MTRRPKRTLNPHSLGQRPSAHKDIDGTGPVVEAADASARAMGEGYPGSLHLPRTSLPAQMPDGLADLGQPGCAYRMPSA